MNASIYFQEFFSPVLLFHSLLLFMNQCSAMLHGLLDCLEYEFNLQFSKISFPILPSFDDVAVVIEAVEADVCPRSRQPPRLCRLLKMMLSSKSTEFFLELIFCLSSSSKLKDSLLRRQFIEAKFNKGFSKHL